MEEDKCREEERDLFHSFSPSPPSIPYPWGRTKMGFSSLFLSFLLTHDQSRSQQTEGIIMEAVLEIRCPFSPLYYGKNMCR